jgi:hypothetical protein
MGNKTLLQLRVDMRADLKDSGSLWSDAELDRCIERAVSDFSRYLPKEEVYEESLQFTVTSEAFTTPVTTSLTAIVNAQSLDVAGGSLLTIAGQPDVPRPLTLTMTDADNSAYGVTIIITGANKDGKSISETFHWSRGMSKTMVGVKEFKTVYEVELDQDAGSHAGDTLSVGYGLFTTAWKSLAYKPIKWGSETASVGVRDTDFYMDYANGRIKAIAGGLLAANTAYTISYTKSQISVDLSSLTDMIRVQRAEYPVGGVPQDMVSVNGFGSILYVSGGAESEGQVSMQEDKHIRVYYDARHIPPTLYTPGTYPSFLEDTVLMAADAYALLIYALKSEHQAVTDLASVRAALVIPNTTVTGLHVLAQAALALTDTQLDAAIKAGSGNLMFKVATALDAVATKLGTVDTYLTGSTAPAAKKYLDDGDAILNTVAVGGEGQDVPRAYREYAQASVEIANALIAEANAYVTEASVRLGESDRWVAAGRAWVEQANSYIAEIDRYLAEAAQYAEAASADMLLADRLKAEALERRNEVYAIWKDRKEYIGDFTMSSTRQMP